MIVPLHLPRIAASFAIGQRDSFLVAHIGSIAGFSFGCISVSHPFALSLAASLALLRVTMWDAKIQGIENEAALICRHTVQKNTYFYTR